MKVLVACEESQAVCKAFREKEHKAFGKQNLVANNTLGILLKSQS